MKYFPANCDVTDVALMNEVLGERVVEIFIIDRRNVKLRFFANYEWALKMIAE